MSKYLELFKESFNDSINEKTKLENKPYIGYSLTDGKLAYTVVSEPTLEHEYVDLGLSVKWATCNIGASKPEDYGDYFAWGETEPKSTYDWSTYKWCNGSNDTQTKYCIDDSYGTVDNKTTLEAADDASTVNWSDAWRMPTDAELTELLEQCTWTWITQNGVDGYQVTSDKNGNSIFLPAGGRNGTYWSNKLATQSSDSAYNLYFHSALIDVNGGGYRCYAGFVRPVYP